MEPWAKKYKHSPPHPIPVIVIDSLDECGSDPSQAGQRKVFLDTLLHWSHLPRTFKLIVTGWDERVPASFRASRKQIKLPTGEEITADAKQDVRQFLELCFAEISGLFSADWPGEKVLDILTTWTAGLLIWAATVVRFVERNLPDKQLEHVLSGTLGKGIMSLNYIAKSWSCHSETSVIVHYTCSIKWWPPSFSRQFPFMLTTWYGLFYKQSH